MQKIGKWTGTKYFLKGFLLNTSTINAVYVYSFFGTLLPYVVEDLLGIEYDSDEYTTLYNVCYVLFCLTMFIGGVTGGPFLRTRKRLNFLIILDISISLVSFLLLFPSYFTFILVRFVSGFLVGATISANFYLTSELNLPEVSGIFLTNTVLSMPTGCLLSSLMSFAVELDWGWDLSVFLIFFFSGVHIIILLVFFRKETPIFLLLIQNSEENCQDSLGYYLNDPVAESLVFQRVQKEKEIRINEPSFREILKNKIILKRNIRASIFGMFFELFGCSTVAYNWTEIGTLLLGSIIDNPTSYQIKIFVTCAILCRIISMGLSGLVLNFFRRKVFMIIILPIITVTSFWVFIGSTWFSLSIFWPGIILLFFMCAGGSGTNVVAGELASRVIYSIGVGLLRVIILFYAILYTLFGLESIFLAIGLSGIVALILYLTIYKETFRKTLAEIEQEEMSPKFAPI